MAVIGSSLGGFYATAVAERTGCRAVLLNPAVDPARDLHGHIGETTAWHSDERFCFRAEYIDELRGARGAGARPARNAISRSSPRATRCCRGEEMAARYRGAPMKLLEGSDHALGDFDSHWPDAMRFLRLDVN